MRYEDKKSYDQVAGSLGARGLAGGQGGIAELFSSFFPQDFHSTPTVRPSGNAAVFQDRLPRHHSDAQGLLRPPQGSGSEESAALLDPLLRREKAGKKRAFEILLESTFKHAKAFGLIDKAPQGAIDSTGLETRHTSQHYISCSRRPSFYRRRWPKITVVCHTRTHLIAGCIVSGGPSYDCPHLPKAMTQADRQIHFDQLLADAGYDSESNHHFCREVLGIRSTVIACNRRGTEKLPSTRYRRQMAQRFSKKAYGNRWQVESVFSRNKRLLGSALRARTDSSRERECFLRILTHNLMIIRRAA